jgi:hypothetical protein
MRKCRMQNAECRMKTKLGAARLILFCILHSAFCISLFGCNILGVLAYKTRGPAPVPAEYVPAKEPMLVLAENYRNPAAVRLDADRMGRHISAELERYHVAPIIAPDALDEVRARPGFATMKLGQVGAAAGAKQVLYVNLIKFNVEPAIGSEMIRGQVEMSVRVVDSASGKTLWPADEPEGKLLSLETPYLRTGAGTGPSGGGPGATEAALRDTMCRQMAERTVKLFRKWTPDFDNEDQTK